MARMDVPHHLRQAFGPRPGGFLSSSVVPFRPDLAHLGPDLAHLGAIVGDCNLLLRTRPKGHAKHRATGQLPISRAGEEPA